jgi:subtilase family serine protease
MNNRHFLISAAVVSALGCAVTPAFPAAAITGASSAFGTAESARVAQPVSNLVSQVIPKTRLSLVSKASSSAAVAGSVKMNNLQLILKPSALRSASMEALIANQHDPKSSQFQKWLSPQEFGANFGVVDSDVAAVTSWLTAQGFTVNSVYPNKLQIDFSGTVAQVNQAFHTTETRYTFGKETHLANATEIAVPAALAPVVAGVMGLNDFHPTALHTPEKSKIATWDASKKAFSIVAGKSGATKSPSQAVTFHSGTRGLVPNDMATIYGVRTIRDNGVTGKGVTIALVEDGDMTADEWNNFVSVFNLGRYGGTLTMTNPAPPTGDNNCFDPDPSIFGQSEETILDAEWSTAIAPGANVVVASCSSYNPNDNYAPTTSNFFGGIYISSVNLINAATRPDIISVSYGYGEYFVDAASKTAIDQMWAQADAEGISVFVSTGDSGSNASYNGAVINGYFGNTAVDANALATSPHDTAVGGTDLADVLDGTTSKYFAPTPSVVGGSALSYVPEIPWNASCGNGVAAKANGFSSATAFCLNALKTDINGFYNTSEGASGGPSSVDAKPSWQRQVFNAAKDQSRDLPDVSLFAGSYGDSSLVIVCDQYYPCTPGFSTPTQLIGGTSLSTPMFAGIQALMDQGLKARGLPLDQGNAAPTLYALATSEFGSATGATPASLATCNADNGATGTANCVFHNVTRGSISTNCVRTVGVDVTPNCYYYGYQDLNLLQVGLTSTQAAPTDYSPTNKAFSAGPGWSFANGLGSVNATNLLIAWRAFDNAPPATISR